jgi:hypothetical protein
MCALAFSKNEILKANVPLCPPLLKAIWHKLHGRSLLLPLFQRKLPPKFFPTAPMFARSGKHVTEIRWLGAVWPLSKSLQHGPHGVSSGLTKTKQNAVYVPPNVTYNWVHVSEIAKLLGIISHGREVRRRSIKRAFSRLLSPPLPHHTHYFQNTATLRTCPLSASLPSLQKPILPAHVCPASASHIAITPRTVN